MSEDACALLYTLTRRLQRRLTEAEVRDTEEAHRKPAVLRLRRSADRVQVTHKAGRSTPHSPATFTNSA